MNAGEAPEPTLGVAGRLLARRVGLRLNPAVSGRLSRSVVEEAKAHQMDVSTYAARLDTDPALLQGLVDRITVQETSFFRDPGQLEAFRNHVVAGWQGALNVWSAGCAHGQEPYSLAMILAESGAVEWQVTASDVSTRALERTRRGRYSAREMKGVSPQLRARYFRPVGDEYEVVASLRERVRVVHHNVVAQDPPFEPGGLDVVFCRSVLIYVDQPSVVSTIERLARWLHPAGWLFLGYSESLWQVTDAFSLVRLDEGFAYRLRDRPAFTAPSVATTMRRRQTGRLAPGAGLPGDDGAAPPARRGREMSAPSGGVAGEPPSGTAEVTAAGEEAMTAGAHDAAVVAFRKAAYLAPDQPVAHLHLGLALEATGDVAAARRAYAAARAALDESGDSAVVETTLEGYRVAELARLLDAKIESCGPGAGA